MHSKARSKNRSRVLIIRDLLEEEWISMSCGRGAILICFFAKASTYVKATRAEAYNPLNGFPDGSNGCHCRSPECRQVHAL